jgi:ligand-binding sensor domain-containing protein
LPHNLDATTSNVPHSRTPVLTPSDYIRTDFTVENRLPNNIIPALVQTQNGVLWVGTESGFASFDGRTFRPINLQTQGSPPMWGVHSLLASSEGDLWVGCEAGVVRIPKAGLDQFTSARLTFFQVGPGASDAVEVLLQSRGGALWAGTKHGLFREVSGKFVNVILPVYGDLGIDKDPDLKSLHGDPRFDSLVADAKERAAGPQKPLTYRSQWRNAATMGRTLHNSAP